MLNKLFVFFMLLYFNEADAQLVADSVFYVDGQLKEVGKLEEGTRNGLWKWYYPDGTLGAEITYKTNNIEGLRLIYDFSGKLIEKETWAGNAKQDSSWYFYPNGQLHKKGQYFNDLYVGEWQHFSEAGKLIRKGNYTNGLPTGYWQFWYDDGTLWMEGNFVDGKEEGNWKSYRTDGSLEYEGRYKQGIKVEPWYYIKPNGKRKRYKPDEN